MVQEQRAYVLAARTAQTTSVNETGYVVLPRSAEGAVFYFTVISASGSIRAVIQRGYRRAGTGTVGQVCQNGLIIDWADWISFSSVAAAGTRMIGVVRTSTANDSAVTTTGTMGTNMTTGGPLGAFFRASTNLSGASATFDYEITGEFEF